MGGDFSDRTLCPDCFGAGEIVVDAKIRRGAFGQLQYEKTTMVTKPCERCKGTGHIAPPARLDVLVDGEWRGVEGIQ